MNGWERRARLHPAAEGATAFVAAAVFFVLAAVAIPVRDLVPLVVLLGLVYLYVVFVAARRLGPLYAVPLAIAGGLGFDSFYIPPTRDFGPDDWENWLAMAIYIALGVLIGMLTARSQRRARSSEHARGMLGEEQAALRRVATLVARNVPAREVFAAVAREVGRLLGVDATHMGRYEPNGAVIGVASWSRDDVHLPIGTQASLEGESVTAAVKRSGHPARINSYESVSGAIASQLRELGIRSSVGVPIVVEGRPWGVMVVSSKAGEPLPSDTEARTARFTELVAMAISNTEARTKVKSLADEQAALRRVATLVARGVPPSELFGAVTEEVGRLLGSDLAGMIRYEDEDTLTAVAAWSAGGQHADVGGQWTIDGGGISYMIAKTGRPVRIDDYRNQHGHIPEFVREVLGVRSSIGTPIVVEGRLWGALMVHSTHEELLPPDIEARLMNFTELVATAIANANSRAELTASRARVLAAADEARRRVVRDLHDGAQQRLVHTIITLKLARRAMHDGDGAAQRLLDEALAQADDANAELRELAHGILPSVLTRGGLRSGVNALVSRMHLPLKVEVSADRFPPGIEASAYFVVAEALTNVTKHSRAEHAEIKAWVEDSTLHVEVRDDGVGGATPHDAGLVELDDRVTALGGHLEVDSPEGSGTVVAATLPLPV